MAAANLDIVIKARNEASETFRGLEHMGNRLAHHFVGILGATVALDVGFGAAALGMAKIAEEAAVAKGNAEGILKAQLETERTAQELVGSIPVIGTAIRKAMDAFSDRKPIEEAIKNIEEIGKAVKAQEEENRKLIRETAIERAKQTGGDAAAAQKKAEFDAQDRAAKSIDAAKVTGDARAAFNKAQAQVDADQKQYDRQKKASQEQGFVGRWFGGTGGNWMALDDQKRKLEAAQAIRDDRAGKFEAAQNAAGEQRKASAEKAATDLNAAYLAEVEESTKRNKEQYDADQKAFEERKKLQQDMTDWLLDENAKRIEGIRRQGEELLNNAKAAGRSEAEQAAISAATKNRIEDEQVRQDEQRAAKQQAEEDARAGREKAAADQGYQLQQTLLRSAGKNREADANDVRRRYAAMREDAAKNIEDEKARAARMALIRQAETAELKKLGIEAPAQAPQTTAVQAVESRFLSRGPQTATPGWVKDQLAAAKQSNDWLKVIAEQTGVTVEQVGIG